MGPVMWEFVLQLMVLTSVQVLEDLSVHKLQPQLQLQLHLHQLLLVYVTSDALLLADSLLDVCPSMAYHQDVERADVLQGMDQTFVLHLEDHSAERLAPILGY